MSEDDALRRQQEINAFAAMAAGDFSSINFDSNSVSKVSQQAESEEETNNEDGSIGLQQQQEEKEQDAQVSMFAKAAAQVEDSGTFSFKKKEVGKMDIGRSNLEAAAAALSDDPDIPSSSTPPPPSVMKPQMPLQRTSSAVPPKMMKNRLPMHTQQVYLPRPLFFGPDIPPKIVEEARQIVAQGLEEQGYDGTKPPEINTLPPSVRNLIGAFRTYGNGISILPGEKEQQVKASPYVSVFCPKWSEEAKLDPYKKIDTFVGEDGTTYTETTGSESMTVAAESTREKDDSATPAGQDTVERQANTSMSERDWFSMMARGEEDMAGSFGNASAGTNKSLENIRGLASASSDVWSGVDDSSQKSSGSGGEAPVPMSNRDLFSQWARGESSPHPNSSGHGNSMIFTENSGKSSPNAASASRSDFFNSGTFLNIVAQEDSDDDSVVGSELKKKVGVNEHLNAALASLEAEWQPSENGGQGGGVEETPDIAIIPLTVDGARPLSNHELMDGSVPLFGVDDPPLPAEADLGIHETRDEQQRSREQRKIQAIIETCCPQNIFGTLACPNPAMNPDDNHSWNNSRSGFSQRIGNMPQMGGGIAPIAAPLSPDRSPSSAKSPATDKTSNRGKPTSTKDQNASFPFPKKAIDPRSRFGWWNSQDDEEKEESAKGSSNSFKVNTNNAEDSPIQLPPLDHSSFAPFVETGLEPKPETLHKQNRSLSHLHPATSLAQSLPFLSDRPASYRYLQVDTQAVGFPALGGEIEPLFCSLAIYHVEVVPNSIGTDPNMAPIPDLQRCGKITETLNFDVVSDPDIEKQCAAALWPYATEQSGRGPGSQGTRCGVFPLPSNLSIHNLYAAITVNKVISEGSDFEVYLRPGKSASETANRQDKVNIESLRARAEKASNRQGKFTIPFAFGVAPLLQVFGADIPLTPSSRAVQIPLFRFSSGIGERQIIDHIMVMLYPRADHSLSGIGGPAPVTNGGTAMLVMRNFGYLGLHSVVNSKSSLARDRLVDFTGEMQIRRQDKNPQDEDHSLPQNSSKDILVVPEWRQEFISEPTIHGGRNTNDSDVNAVFGTSKTSRSHLYAQELGPLALHSNSSKQPTTPQGLKAQRNRAAASGYDIEPYYQTSYCNQLLCHPKLLRNCPKGNIVVKIEVREMEWNEEYSAYFAHLPTSGPAIHNPRRGPFLVPWAFTSCSSRCIDPKFLDEFKVRLPLILAGRDEESTRRLSLFFVAYKLSFSTRKKWTRRLRGSKRTGQKVDEIAADIVGETTGELDSFGSCQLIQLGCGHLPIANSSSIVANGNHEVKITNLARYPNQDVCENGKFNPSTLIVSELTDGGKIAADLGRNDADDSQTDSESVNSGHIFAETASVASASDSIGRSDTTEEIRLRLGKSKSGISEAIILQVRISVQSSVHAQNQTLGEFFCQESAITPSLNSLQKGIDPVPFSKISRDDILKLFSSNRVKNVTQATAYDREKLLISTVDISKPSMCSVSDVSSNFLRVILQLWKIAIAGTVESDLEWANPNAVIPLRIHAFATMLQLLGSSTLFLSKRGLTQLDGKSKWNLKSLSRVLALFFDEGNLFGEQAEEPFSKEFFTAKQSGTVKPSKNSEKRRRHVRSNFEFQNNSDSLGDDNIAIVFSGSANGSDLTVETQPDMEFQTKAKEIAASWKEGKKSPRNSSSGELSSDGLTSEPSEMTESSTTPWIDSVTDFKTALETGYREAESESDQPQSDTEGKSSGEIAAAAMINAFSGPAVGRRRWMTAPAPNLATIKEDAAGGDSPFVKDNAEKPLGPLDSLDTEMFLKPSTSKTKQFRRPQVRNRSNTLDLSHSEDSDGPSLEDIISGMTSDIEAFTPEEKKQQSPAEEEKRKGNQIPTSDDEIESAGISFLEAIEKSFGLSGVASSNPNGEDKRVGHAHHRKTRSHCSIDWTIPNDDLHGMMHENVSNGLQNKSESVSELDMSMSTLSQEKEICTKLPSFVDRLISLEASGSKKNGRWFPFAYEVVILQWLALLREQQTSNADKQNESADAASQGSGDGSLSEAASRTGGVTVACAPVLFQMIKQSLGWRVAKLFQRIEAKNIFKDCPPLVTLDDSLLASLEELIAIVTDACLDSRNFDAWETLRTCVDVNDSIVHFLRDLFAFIDPTSVHRLIMVYMSHLRQRDNSLQDRDSNIGLRWSWEITKLQMNAISAFVRFPDFIRVNSPQAIKWGDWWTTAPALSSASFFDNVLSGYDKLGFTGFDDDKDENPTEKTMLPHWLSELVIEMCVLGIEHAEHNIQRRSAALLLELFWEQSQESFRDGSSSIIATMYVTFLEKIISRSSYLSSCFLAKSQVRQDVIRCVVFVLQSAPSGLLRAFWRRLCWRGAGKGVQDKFGGIGFAASVDPFPDVIQENPRRFSRSAADYRQDHDIFEMFSLLNLSLATLEYEGSDEFADADGSGDTTTGPRATWRKEYVFVREQETMDMARRRRLLAAYSRTDDQSDEAGTDYATSGSRKWHAHDGSLVVIKTTTQIVRELRFVLEPSEAAQSFFNPRRRSNRASFGSQAGRDSPQAGLNFSYSDTIIFVRAATSVYLHALTLRQSDIVLVKALNASVEIVKIFGIKIFSESVGETLQHWMRVVSFHCGARRSEVRVPASDFLELILRSTWDTFGSFFRIRLPLLAVQTEVMERIVATAAARHYRDQRKMANGSIEFFSNGSAEASLAPLWRTLDRLHHQSASQNVAFKSALIRLAEKLKKLFRAYIAAHALSFLNRSKLTGSSDQPLAQSDIRRNLEAETLIRVNRTRVHRVINASAGYSKQFLGFYSTSLEQSDVAHHEAVEDAFLDAADVFSPTELPDHRVAWLRKLAEFHEARCKYAEEATCHFHIYVTYEQASRLHGALWSSTPFFPWTDNRSDGIHLDEEGLSGELDEDFDETPDLDYGGRHVEKTNQFRRIFYRHQNSIRNGELEAGSHKFAFSGVVLASEYHTVSPWISLKEMEENMLEEAEAAGDLFLLGGIVASSRHVWGLVSRYYADKFCYGKLAHVYERLSRTVVSQVPPVDSSLYQEVCVTEPVGRFYRVWFHGGAPDELMGAEFVYRTASSVTLDQFGKELRGVVRCIVPEKTPIHLVLDGRPDESSLQNYSSGYSRMSSALEPVKVKVTPLRPLMEKSSRMRGLPEWFNDYYIDIAFDQKGATGLNYRTGHRSMSMNRDSLSSDPGSRRRDHGRSFSASVFSSAGTGSTSLGTRRAAFNDSRRLQHDSNEGEGALVGADKFSFIQPINKAHSRATRDWLKGSSSDFAEKTLRVTELQVGQAFPACVSRQVVVHRVVYTQSPLEAAVDGTCQWCAVLFRTAIATNGMAVLGINYDPGIGTDAAKVVSDCMHTSRVKEMGLYLLNKNTNVEEEEDADVLQTYDRLGEDEVNRLQLKLARALVVFMELIHLLVARNRDLLLSIIHDRKTKGEGGSSSQHSRDDSRTRMFPSRPNSTTTNQEGSERSRDDSLSRSHKHIASWGSVVVNDPRIHKKISSLGSSAAMSDSINQSHKQMPSMGSLGITEWELSSNAEPDRARTDAAIAIQSELQRNFVSMAKDLYPMVLGIMGSETPKWLKLSCQESYFSSGTYRNTKLGIGEELAFEDNVSPATQEGSRRGTPAHSASASVRSQTSHDSYGIIPIHSRSSSVGLPYPTSPGGTISSSVSRGSDAARSQKSQKSTRSMKSYDRFVAC